MATYICALKPIRLFVTQYRQLNHLMDFQGGAGGDAEGGGNGIYSQTNKNVVKQAFIFCYNRLGDTHTTFSVINNVSIRIFHIL
jgi:hypothetical protein